MKSIFLITTILMTGLNVQASCHSNIQKTIVLVDSQTNTPDDESYFLNLANKTILICLEQAKLNNKKLASSLVEGRKICVMASDQMSDLYEANCLIKLARFADHIMNQE